MLYAVFFPWRFDRQSGLGQSGAQTPKVLSALVTVPYVVLVLHLRTVLQGQECKRQLAILFSFLQENQPTDLIEGLLGDVDNGQVLSLVVADPGGGYTGSVPKVRALTLGCCPCLPPCSCRWS